MGDDYNNLLWKRIEKVSFFYSLKKVRNTNQKFKKGMIALLFGLSIFMIYTLYIRIKVPLNDFIWIFLLSIGLLFSLIILLFIIFLSFENIRFTAEMYEKWMNIRGDTRMYEELKDIKLYQYSENWAEYIKLIYTEIDDRILTKTYLWNSKMERLLDKFQEILPKKWINCEKVNDIKNLDISDEIEYKARFWFFTVWNLLSEKEKLKRIKSIFIIYLCALFLLFIWMIYNRKRDFSLENIKSDISIFLILAWILLILIIVYFIQSMKKFYARKENNAVYIRKYTWLSDNYVLSKIKVNYWFITEWNTEWIILTINFNNTETVYKRPKNEEVERFCSELVDTVKKYRKS